VGRPARLGARAPARIHRAGGRSIRDVCVRGQQPDDGFTLPPSNGRYGHSVKRRRDRAQTARLVAFGIDGRWKSGAVGPLVAGALVPSRERIASVLQSENYGWRHDAPAVPFGEEEVTGNARVDTRIAARAGTEGGGFVTARVRTGRPGMAVSSYGVAPWVGEQECGRRSVRHARSNPRPEAGSRSAGSNRKRLAHQVAGSYLSVVVEPVALVSPEPLGVVPMFKRRHGIEGESHDEHITAGVPLSPMVGITGRRRIARTIPTDDRVDLSGASKCAYSHRHAGPSATLNAARNASSVRTTSREVRGDGLV
jgi:hypothetical protein